MHKEKKMEIINSRRLSIQQADRSVHAVFFLYATTTAAAAATCLLHFYPHYGILNGMK